MPLRRRRRADQARAVAPAPHPCCAARALRAAWRRLLLRRCCSPCSPWPFWPLYICFHALPAAPLSRIQRRGAVRVARCRSGCWSGATCRSAFVRAPPGTLVGEGDPDSVQPHSRHAFMRGLLHRPPDVAASIAAQSPTAARGGRAVLVSGRGSSRLAERGGRHGFSKLLRVYARVLDEAVQGSAGTQ